MKVNRENPSILFVVQRYGAEVNGGAETLCREIAERLVEVADVQVATSCAIRYKERFEDDCDPGMELLNGVQVRRFGLSRLRSDAEEFAALDRNIIARNASSEEELEWLREIGPYSRELEHFVLDNAYRFNLIVYVTYLYAPTTLLLPKTAHKAVLIPNAHDESPLKAAFFDLFFSVPRFVACNAQPELALLRERSTKPLPDAKVVAMGFDKPTLVESAAIELPAHYLLYAGRIQSEKGCDELFEFYLNLPSDLMQRLPLLLVGSAVMEIPTNKFIHYLGFVSEEEKNQVMANATALIMPSRQESLSIVLMESWLCNVPAIVNSKSEVLQDHIVRSGGGFGYSDQPSFTRAVETILALGDEGRRELALKGERYTVENYSWQRVTDQYLDYSTQIQGAAPIRRKLCLVVQRCGPEVNGGAEFLCFQIAKRLNRYHDVTVVSTCARDYTTWEDYYPQGEDEVEGVRVIRFSVDQIRNQSNFDSLSEDLRARAPVSVSEGEAWIKEQGPYSTSLLRYLEEHEDDYDCFIFYTYLYATTYFGIQAVGHKSLLAPFVHDEWMLELGIWDSLFANARSTIFSTPAERSFLREKFSHLNVNGPVVGVAVDRPAKIDPVAFREKFGIYDDFMIYVGRIDESKGCKELFDLFFRFRKTAGSEIKLVLIGNSVIDIPEEDSIYHLGFVDEQDKWNALAASNFLVLPSRYESLSMVIMEAWTVSKPVLVNGACEVLVDQCRRSNGGIWYDSPAEFTRCAEELTQGVSASVLGRQGNDFVRAYYDWKEIDQQYLDLVDLVIHRNSKEEIG